MCSSSQGERALAGRALPAGATIHVIPYTHADIAWVHSRAWHVDRYVRAMDEVLDLLDRDAAFRYYVDTWVEWMKPYIALRPHNVERLRRHIAAGRLAVCCGHHGNVRSTQVGDETFIRNLQLGMRHWRQLAPEARPTVYANMDVAIGHSQVPQLLRLAGIGNYFAWRPQAALDAQGVPRAFHWRGLSGDTVLVCRAEYGGLYTREARRGDAWDADWDAVVADIHERYLRALAADGLTDLPLCVGSDDSRPDRWAYHRDEPCGYRDLIRLWNEREPTAMRFSTPDELFASLAAAGDRIKTIAGVLDATDVCYNAAWNGRRGIWWLREQADRLLVDAEILSTLARLVKGAPYPAAELGAAWERLLAATPHAVQLLFARDWQAEELGLRRAITDCHTVIEQASGALAGACIPTDAAGLAVFNTLPFERREVMPLWITNSDLARGRARLFDANGAELQTQVFFAGPHANGEYGLLAEVGTPACGYAALRVVYSNDMPEVAPSAAVRRKTLRVTSDRVGLTFRGGRLVRIDDLSRAVTRAAPAGAGFLDPAHYPITSDDWFVGSGIPDEPDGYEVEGLRLDEQGPLRWRVTRTGRVAGFWIRQHIDLVRGEPGVRCTTEFAPPSEPRQGLLALSIPLPAQAQLTADIPFGVEPRDIASCPYVGFERVIRGMLWARTWVAATDKLGLVALVAEDGDKFFLASGSPGAGKPRRLAHFLARQFPRLERIWESCTAAHDLGGRQAFHHRLALGDGDWRRADLVGLAQRLRHPLRQQWVGEEALGADASWMSVSPGTVRLSGLTCEGEEVLLRIAQMAPTETQATVTLPSPPTSAETVDFNGNTQPPRPRWRGSTVLLRLRPWQIATLRLRFR